MTGTRKFTLTANHVALLRRAYVSWCPIEYGAPTIEPKRPFGSSGSANIERDICATLGWEMAGDDGDGPCYSSKQREAARTTYQELETALQVVLCTGSFTPGTYRESRQYDSRSWVLDEGGTP